MIFLNPLGALIPKIPFSFFGRFLGLGHLRGPGVSLGRILGVPSIEPFFLEGGPAGGLYRHPSPPPQTKTWPDEVFGDLCPVTDVPCGALYGPPWGDWSLAH